MNNRTIFGVLIACLALLVTGIVGYRFGVQTEEPVSNQAGQTSVKIIADEPLFYSHPMNPDITSPVPAKDSMGMDYVPVYADAGQNDGLAGTVEIDPVTVQNIGVRTARAETRAMAVTIQTVGRVDYDEQRLVKLHPKTEGWIEELFIETTGEPVEADTILLSLYSPQLVSTQQEYVLALNNLARLRESPFEDVRNGAEQLVRATEERLRLLDVPDHQIERLKTSLEISKGLHIHSPAAGIVTAIGARDGQYVTPKTELYAIADLSKVWVLVDVYEDEFSWVKTGDTARMTVTAVPGKTFVGTLSYIYPYAESQTRTIKVRMEFDNPDLLLKPDMFANVTIEASELPAVTAVPSEAIVRSGVRNQLFIQREPGKFEPRVVVTGVSANGWTQVLQGVEPGELVVVSSQFLIDSESKLREATAKMLEIRDD